MKTKFGSLLKMIFGLLALSLILIFTGYQEEFSVVIGLAGGLTVCTLYNVPKHHVRSVTQKLAYSVLVALVVPIAYGLSGQTSQLLLSWAIVVYVAVFLVLGFFWNLLILNGPKDATAEQANTSKT